MYARLTSACHRKCIAPKYREAELQKGESVCIDRCVAKVSNNTECWVSYFSSR